MNQFEEAKWQWIGSDFLYPIREENNFLWFNDSFLFYIEFFIFEKFIL